MIFLYVQTYQEPLRDSKGFQISKFKGVSNYFDKLKNILVFKKFKNISTDSK